MNAWRWNGAAFESADSVPLSDRGFRYGMSVFESIRVAGGEPEFFERHLSRLISACAERDFAVDEHALRATAELLSEDGFARLYVTAGDGAPAAATGEPRIYVLTEERSATHEDCYEITLCEETYRSMFGGLKTGNYWFNANALAVARHRGFDEALLFNEFAELVSACMANIFLVRDDRIVTPARSSGCRAGVIREWVIARRKVEERRLRREDVVNAEEIFLTSSWLGVMPVATVEGRALGYRWIGPKLAAELENRRSS